MMEKQNQKLFAVHHKLPKEIQGPASYIPPFHCQGTCSHKDGQIPNLLPTREAPESGEATNLFCSTFLVRGTGLICT